MMNDFYGKNLQGSQKSLRSSFTKYRSLSMKYPSSTSASNSDRDSDKINSKDDIFARPSTPSTPTDSSVGNRLNLINSKVTRTGRQRKILATRTKGGEFEAKKKKRRVNFCCLCSELDLESLHDRLIEMQLEGGDSEGNVWETKMYEDVLHIFQTKKPTSTHTMSMKVQESSKSEIKNSSGHSSARLSSSRDNYHFPSKIPTPPSLMRSHSLNEAERDGESTHESDDYDTNANINANNSSHRRKSMEPKGVHELTVIDTLEDMSRSIIDLKSKQSTAVLWSTGAREAFIFEFGAVVFWGFPKGEEDDLIELIREYIEQGAIADDEFDEGRDDMAFVTSSGIGKADTDITIANDVITLPDESAAKSRMSVSFAIAQSAVLNIFEARVETKVKEFKYIPDSLSNNNDLQLTQKQLGMMIGEVYRIRHDVNLHSEILDTPDFFWKEEACELIYKMTCNYLELKARTDVLNTRVDMLRELLAVLQQRQDNSSASGLEWIVIWLIVVMAAAEALAMVVTYLLNKGYIYTVVK